MFGNDNNQIQNDNSGTMGLASNAPSPSSTFSSGSLTPSLSTDIENTNENSSNIPTDTIPQFIPPDADGHIQQAPAENSSKETNLMDIKKDALSKLGPLVDKLEQTPEEKFKTLMMMIQASDDQTMLPKAYNAADSIQDENLKARALLDIVNEINYFTGGANEDNK